MNFTFVSFAVVVSIAKKVFICENGSSIMSTVSRAFTDSTKVPEQDYTFSKRITPNSVCIYVEMCFTNSLLIVIILCPHSYMD